ncbi:MAG TPA: V-type ATP synthase subunit D, partial [Gaiellaceae bacterium]|nr:V-type ATP synthase subunit D [Gaiellaceae bacterium]
MQQLNATRSELLARRVQIVLAVQGRDLLVEKRAALMREFSRLGASVLEAMQALERGAGDAERALRDSVVADGPEAVRSAALASGGETPLLLKARSVAGVPIVEIEHEAVVRPREGRGFSLAGTSARTDEVADRFEGLLEGLLDLAALELS